MSQLPAAPTDIPRYRRIDVIGGLFVCVIAATVWLGSMGLAVGELSYFGPGFMPRILAVVLLVCGLALIAFGLTQPPSAAEGLVFAIRGPIAVGLAILLFALTIRGSSFGPVRIPQFGILITGPLTVIVAGLGGRQARPRELVVLGIGLTAASVLVFADALNMQLPVFPAFIADRLPIAWGLEWPRRTAVVIYAAAGYGLWRAFGLSLADLRNGTDGEPAS